MIPPGLLLFKVSFKNCTQQETSQPLNTCSIGIHLKKIKPAEAADDQAGRQAEGCDRKVDLSRGWEKRWADRSGLQGDVEITAMSKVFDLSLLSLNCGGWELRALTVSSDALLCHSPAAARVQSAGWYGGSSSAVTGFGGIGGISQPVSTSVTHQAWVLLSCRRGTDAFRLGMT